MPDQVLAGNAEDASAIAAVLANAFLDDPVMSWLVPGPRERREARLLDVFTPVTASFVRTGQVVGWTGSAAAALWVRPGQTIKSSGSELRQMARCFGWRSFRGIRSQSYVEKHHPRASPHWYLLSLGVHSDSQGAGLGSRLLAEQLAVADREAMPAYLESSNIKNVPLYQRHGFVVQGELRLLGRGPTIWRMWREPDLRG